jgi:hypothetical protein
MVSMLVGCGVLVAIVWGLGVEWGRGTAPNRCACGAPTATARGTRCIECAERHWGVPSRSPHD